MNEEEKKQELLKKLDCGNREVNLEDVDSVMICGYSKFQTAEDLELLTLLPKLEELWLDDSLEGLTTEKLIHILGNIPTLKKLSLRNYTITSSLLKGILELKNIDDIHLFKGILEDSALEALCGQTHLKGLDFCTRDSLPENILDILSTLPQLESLYLYGFSKEASDMLDFAKENLPNIKNLDWCCFSLSAADIETMISMKLESFKLLLAHLDPEYKDLQFLNRFESLKKIDISSRTELTKIDWNLPNLTDISIDFGPDVQLIDFSGMPHLKRIVLYSIGTNCESNVEIKGLDSLKELEYLRIQDVLTSCPIISELKNSTELSSLEVSDVYALKPEDLHHLKNLKNLEYLGFDIDESLSVSEIENMPVLPKLSSLQMNNTSGNGIVSAFVSKCPDLKSLTVHGKIGDDEIRALASKKIYTLSLKDCSNLSAESINTIFSMKELEWIRLTNAPNETIEVRDFPYLRSLELINWKNLMEAEFANLPALYELPLTCPALETLKIDNLPDLRELKLQNCPMVYYMVLHDVPKLSFLNVLGTPEVDLTALIRFPELEKLEMTLDQLNQDFVLETLQELPK